MPRPNCRFLLSSLFLGFIALLPTIKGQVPAQGLYREVYTNIVGTALSDLTNNAAFPNSPNITNFITSFEAPVNVLETYGQRVRGYLFPPQSGDYVFWFASDDQGALFLSTDADPAKKVMVAYINSWANSREWTREGNQQSAPIRLEAGRNYFVEGMMKEGGGGDNLAVKWQLPDGTQEEPIPGSRLRPWGTAATAPQITQQPISQTILEGGAAIFNVRATNVGNMFFQWQREQVNIPGANGPNYTNSPALASDNGAHYRCFLSNSVSTAFSSEVLLTVQADSIPPHLASAINASDRIVRLVFDEPVDSATATAIGNYQITGGLTVTGAAFGSDTKTILLTLSAAMTYTTSYTVRVSGVRDRSSVHNTIAANSPISFVAVEYAPFDIGSPSVSGSATFVAGGFDVSGAGHDIADSSDQFHFDYQTRAGNFDFKVRVQSFAGLDMFSKAGLMARESLDANARFAGAFATPSLAGAFELCRSTVAAAVVKTGYAPVNYPDTWLRVARSGNSFTSYASIDGTTWVNLGAVTIAMPATVYLGTAVASRDSARTATAQFRDLGAASGGNIVTSLSTKGEPLAASSRRTGLIISEIMYHPPVRADGKDLEYVEFFNTDPVAENLSGYRIEGAFDYVFPEGTILPSGAFLVLAKDPVALRAVYGINNVIGGYAGALSNDSDVIRVFRKSGAMILEAHYADKIGWPIAADGSGHSLVLARPSYGEAIREAWSASAFKGGSPGRAEPIRSDAYENLVINEILAHTDDPQPDYIEIYNHSNAAVSLAGCFLSDDPTTNKFQFAANATVPARGFLAVPQGMLGFALEAAGETVYLVASNNTRVIDAVRFEGQQNGVPLGRYPDGASQFRSLQSITQGAANAAPLIRNVVINEIMYHPISDLDADEYVELYNQGTSAADLSGWRFTDGIDFTFPTNTVIPARGYLVVAKDAVNLRSKYSQLTTANSIGDYDGTLSNSGERLALSMPDEVKSTNEFGVTTTNIIYIAVAEAQYSQGGRWGQWADGGGSSLERIDPRADGNQPSSWADSNEESKSAWTTIEFTGVLDNGNGGYPPNQLQMHLQGGGECLVDDVEVHNGAGANLIANPGFESDLSGWLNQGAFKASFVEAGRGFNNSKALHVTSPVRGDTGANRIFYNLPANGIASGNTGTLRAKVRWLKGNPEFLLRLRGNWLEAFGKMSLPNNLGTPGLPNSRAVANAGPAIYEVVHDPILPAASQAVVVTARATDPDGVNPPQLRYRLDAASTFSTLAMNDSGTGGDAVANDGIWSATIPGQASGALVAFYVQASDRAAAPVTTTFPADPSASMCLIRWGETQPPGTIATYRLWMTQNTINTWQSRLVLDNSPLDVTFVYGNYRVIYNVGSLYSGSPFHAGYNSPVGGVCDYIVNFRDDELFLGATDFVLNSVGNLDNDDSAQREQDAFWIAQEMGIPFNHRRHVHLFVNGLRRGRVFEDSQQPNANFVEGWFPDDTDGELLKIEDWFEFNDAANSFGNVDANLGAFTTTGGVLKTARYRWSWRPRAVKRSANDFVNFFALVNAANDQTAAYTTRVENTADIEEWMRMFCVEHIVGNWDSYGYNRGKNMFTYRPRNGKWTMCAWDIDFVLGSGGDGTETSMFGVNDGTIGRMYNHPPFRRAFFRAMYDAVNGPLAPQNIGPVLDARYDTLIANGVNAAEATPIKTWVAARRTYLQSQLATVAAPFAITSNNGNNFSTNKNFITLTGSAPVSVKTIEVNGAPYPVTWTTVTNWAMNIPLPSAANVLNLKGYDLRNAEIAGATDSITINYTGALTSPKDIVVINEIMYNPLATNASFVEIANISATVAFDLSGFRLDGADFTFPDGSVIAPNGYLVVAKNAAFFSAAYGSGILIVGEFQGSLDNGGERLKLIKPGARPEEDEIIDEVRYDDNLPWPLAADGTGPSLQLIDPTKDNSRAGNWTVATGTVKYTPGAANNVKATLAAFPTLWINEALPNNTNSITDGAGDRDPWIELYNSGTTAINLNGYYLTDDYNALTKWQLPNFTLNPGQYFIVWADGEPNESVAGAPHTSFRLAPASGSVALTRLQGTAQQPAVVDFINYSLLSANRSYGSYPDGQGDRQVFHFVTPNLANDNTSLVIPVTINEWMASNTRTMADPVDHQFEDWIELYNSGNQPVDLSGYYLTDDLTNKTKFKIPPGYIVPAQGYLIVWADEEKGQNSTTNADLHAEIKLSAGGEEIGLFGSDGTQIDAVTFGPQTDDVSEGRYPDGGAAPFFKMPQPTPRAGNIIPSGNRPPTLSGVTNATIPEGAQYQFQAIGADPDAGQTLTYELAGGPSGATLNPSTGVFQWTPQETDGPGNFQMTIRVSDNGSPVLSRSAQFTLSVTEANLAPQLNPLPDVTIDENVSFAFDVPVTDPDLPAQPLLFFLDENPPGATLNGNSGHFQWTPSEAQGPGTYPVTIRVADVGSPPLSASRRFFITVREVNAAPALDAIQDQLVFDNDTVTIDPVASDADLPTQTLTFTVQGLPGAQINPSTGHFTWTPTASDIPSTNTVTIRATDNGSPSAFAARTFTIVAARSSHPPVLTPVSTQTIPEDTDFSLQLQYTDVDSGQNHTFTLETPITGLALSSAGLITWHPSEAQGPSTNQVRFHVTDDGLPPRGATGTVTVVVIEVNLAPQLTNQFDATIDELVPFTFAAAATDADLPAQPLQYFIDNPPPGASFNTNTGRFDWTPSESQGPGSYPITIRVADSGSPPLVTTNRFTITVREVNAPPTLAAIQNRLIIDGDTLIIDPVASDADLPAQTLSFTVQGLAGAQINPATGHLAWTPGPADVPSTNSVTIRATDSGSPPAFAAQTFTVVVGRSNHPPTFDPLPNQLAPEEADFSLQLVSGDVDPGQFHTFALETAIPGLALSSGGKITWHPNEDQGPSTNEVRFHITDDGNPPRTTTASVTVVVTEINRPPALPAFAQQSARVDEQFALNISATDPDRPNNTLTYSLDAGAPEGAAINPATGRLTWTPSPSFLNSTQNIPARVTDNGTPNLSDAKTIAVKVNPPVVWKFASATGTASTSTIYIYLESPGEVILDDIRLVAGTNAAAGPNLLPNGDFENAITPPWTVSANHANSTITNIAHSGNSGLHVVATSGGTTRASSIFQDIVPALTANAQYTLSYWYVPNTNNINLTVRLSGNGIVNRQSVLQVIDPPPTIMLAATPLVTGELQMVWPARAGLQYRVYYRDDIENGVWVTLIDVGATGATCTYRAPLNAAGVRFFKVQYVP